MASESNGAIAIVQVTDTHLFDDPTQALLGVNTEASFLATIEAVQAYLKREGIAPAALLLTGDLAQDGTAAAYRRLRALLDDLGLPAYCLPGNHDDTQILTGELGDRAIATHLRIALASWQLLLLSSRVPNRVDGELAAETLDWLDATLQATPHTPTLVAFHHPALPLGAAWIDRLALSNAEAFWAICDRHPQVRVVMSGHAHQEFDGLRPRSGTLPPVRYLVTPSTCIQFQPRSDRFQIDSAAPGFRLLSLFPDGTVTTEVRRLGRDRFQPDVAAVGY